MRNIKVVILTSVLIWAAAISAQAGDFDGSRSLLCSVINVIECTPTEGCQATTAENVNLPQFIKVDVEKKNAVPARPIEGRGPSEIKRVEHIGGKLILQGADEGIEKVRDGLGWTAAVSEESGKFILTASGEQVAFVVFGACVPQ